MPKKSPQRRLKHGKNSLSKRKNRDLTNQKNPGRGGFGKLRRTKASLPAKIWLLKTGLEGIIIRGLKTRWIKERFNPNGTTREKNHRGHRQHPLEFITRALGTPQSSQPENAITIRMGLLGFLGKVSNHERPLPGSEKYSLAAR